MNKKVVFSYPFFFYSMYRFHKTKWAFIREWPQMGAVLLVSAIVGFTIIHVELRLSVLGVISPPDLNHDLPKWIENVVSSWPLIVPFALNVYYFMWKDKAGEYIKKFDLLPKDVRQRSHLVSKCFVATFLVLMFTNIFTLEPVV